MVNVSELDKEELKELVIKLSEAYINILPACGELNIEYDSYWIELGELARNIVNNKEEDK